MDRKEYVLTIYHKACMAGLCGTQKDFASLVGVDRSTMSSALSGKERALTKSLESRVRLFAKANHLEEEAATPSVAEAAATAGPGVFIPEAARVLFENMSEALKLQAKLLDKLQGGSEHSSATEFLSPKNFAHKG